MLWSLIYRKLKGNRGCTPITIYESQRLCNLIRTKNNRKTLEINEKQLTFDKDLEEIKLLNSSCPEYRGRRAGLNVLPRLIKKYKENKQFEHHLEALISKNLGSSILTALDNILLENNIIDIDLATKLKKAKGMKNIISHQYGNVDDKIVFESITKKLERDAREFIKNVKKKY